MKLIIPYRMKQLLGISYDNTHLLIVIKTKLILYKRLNTCSIINNIDPTKQNQLKKKFNVSYKNITVNILYFFLSVLIQQKNFLNRVNCFAMLLRQKRNNHLTDLTIGHIIRGILYPGKDNFFFFKIYNQYLSFHHFL